MSPDGTDRSPADPSAGRAIVLVVPTVPLPGGNGLAMRAGAWLQSLARAAPVHVVVVPVADAAGRPAWARVGAASYTEIAPVGPDEAQRHVIAQLGDPGWRDALRATAPLPIRATLAPPSLADEAAAALASLLAGVPPVVAVMREYLVPFGAALARALDAHRFVVDLDDDVEALLAATGDHEEAAAYGRLARTWLPRADAVTLASEAEAAAVARRHGLAHVMAVPNTVAAAPVVAPRPRADRILFVGNFTYAPNAAAAGLLAHEVLPRVRRTRPHATVDLVGAAGGDVAGLAACDGVTVHGHVADVAPHYAATAVVTAPLTAAGGTRIKLLEAFAHRRPVVATPAAAAGLTVADGRELVLAGDAAGVADAIVRVLTDDALADRLVEAAATILHDRYAPDVVAPLARRAVLGDEAGGDG